MRTNIQNQLSANSPGALRRFDESISRATASLPLPEIPIAPIIVADRRQAPESPKSLAPRTVAEQQPVTTVPDAASPGIITAPAVRTTGFEVTPDNERRVNAWIDILAVRSTKTSFLFAPRMPWLVFGTVNCAELGPEEFDNAKHQQQSFARLILNSQVTGKGVDYVQYCADRRKTFEREMRVQRTADEKALE